MSHIIPSQHILVVDDEPGVREALRMVLVFQGHTVEIACDGFEALQKAADQRFHIIFTDLKMPHMSGDELALRIKEKYPSQVVIMVTAYSGSMSLRQKESLPIDFIITKPFDLKTIVSAVQRAHEINKASRTEAQLSLPSQANLIKSSPNAGQSF